MPLLCFPHYMNGSLNDRLTAHLTLCDGMRDSLSKKGQVGNTELNAVFSKMEMKLKLGRKMLELEWLAVIQWHLRNDQIFFDPCQCLI